MKDATDVRVFSNPIHALLNDSDGTRAVRVLATGNVQGHSPSYLTVDEHGRSQWNSFDDVQIIDTNYLPVSQESFRHAASGASKTTPANSRR